MDDRRYHGLHWEDGEARLRGFSASSKGKNTILKIELEVLGGSDSWTLAHLMRSLQEAQQPAPKAEPAPSRGATSRRKSTERQLTLPAPPLRLPDMRNG